MRWCPALVCTALLCGAVPARATVPVSLDLAGGVGLGGGRRAAFGTTGSMAGVLATDLAWRLAPGRALILSGEYIGSGRGATAEPAGIRPLTIPSSAIYSQVARLRSLDGRSVLVGWRHSRPGSGPMLQAAAGGGSLVTRGWHSRLGIALGGAAGWRVVPPPGPVGFVVEARGSYVRSGSSYVGAATLGLGLTIQPR